MKSARTALLLLCAVGAACGQHVDEMPGPPVTRSPAPPPAMVRLGPDLSGVESVSMVQLLAAPLLMNGKAVSVVGYLEPPLANCDDCGTQLCLHKEDADSRLSRNCVGVGLADLAKVSPLTHRYVRLQGVVAAERHQQFTYVSIGDVRLVAPILDREQWKAGIKAQ